MHPRFKDFIEWASKNYELVIIDTPPILAVTDAALDATQELIYWWPDVR
jgi:tyrosine-protein kinase Etk/Wzc